MKRIISFLKTDVKIINSYFLLLVILIILICVGYSSYALFSFSKTSINVIEATVGKLKNNIDTSGANSPVLASNMIPVYYDEINNVWKKADVNNKDSSYQWYSYNSTGDKKGMWANAVTVKEANRQTYLNANVGTPISMDDITTMWVWIPRFNAVTPSNYNGGTKALPNAIDVTFVKESETALDAFTFGTKSLSGFWYAKFELSGTLVSTCTTETCNVSSLTIKPGLVSLRGQAVNSFFYAGRSMEQTGNSFGFVSAEVDTHMSKNNEWGVVAYLTQSIYGRCTTSTTCTEVGINNNSEFRTGIGAAAGSYSSSSAINTYDTVLGMGASTTGNIYGIYDMNGGSYEYVMGNYNTTKGNTTFTTFPDSKYYNLYTGTSYTGHALTETSVWYNDNFLFVTSSIPWLMRGGLYDGTSASGVFATSRSAGSGNTYYTTRMVVTNE